MNYGHKINEYEIKPKEILGTQLHYHNDIHLVNVGGYGLVSIPEENKPLLENEYIFIPRGTEFKIRNEGKINLKLVEILFGNINS